ncbi:hypothetical protein CWI75_04520 [Kineobactrum sediminis]|uniref:Allene oxide cyclase n=1 Tax=Kineobactrum sediminis TaxID=1905677 RepID=A0A2N5Y5G8_9GAMM|nr:hypothetical protein [Kineobactrum sediminis]PLW83619.1 hypothetical protein CWI75_04520 [Kineobactrum sediminis]
MIRTTLLLAALGTVPAAAIAEPVQITLSGGFHATGHAPVATGPVGQAYAYSVRGGTVLRSGNNLDIPVSIDCTGLDHVNEQQETTGRGNCVWRDADDDKLFLSLTTGQNGNTYVLTGGTGKWSGIEGTIATGFTYLPSPEENLYLGVEEGTGALNKWPFAE